MEFWKIGSRRTKLAQNKATRKIASVVIFNFILGKKSEENVWKRKSQIRRNRFAMWLVYSQCT